MAATLRLTLNTLGASCERLLDIPGYIPGISLYSASLRHSLALIQLITGIAMGVFAFAVHVYSKRHHLSNETLILELQASSNENLIDAGLNFVRAYLESIPFINMGLLIFDQGKAIQKNILQNSLAKVVDWRVHVPLLFHQYEAQPMTLSPSLSKPT